MNRGTHILLALILAISGQGAMVPSIRANQATAAIQG